MLPDRLLVLLPNPPWIFVPLVPVEPDVPVVPVAPVVPLMELSTFTKLALLI